MGFSPWVFVYPAKKAGALSPNLSQALWPDFPETLFNPWRPASKINPQTQSAQVSFLGIHRGTYAVTVFHDENGNGKLDKNLVGIPKEGYGASNNPAKKMRPPTFDEARFSVNSDQTIEVKLTY